MASHSHSQRTRPRRLALLGMALAWWIGGCLAVVCFAPAQWLAQGIDGLTDGRMQLLQVRGTVWQGSGQWVLSAGHGSHTALALPQRVTWQWQPLWRGGLQLSIHAECCSEQPLVWQWQPLLTGWQIKLQANRSRWPVAWLSGLGAPWNTIGMQGELRLQHDDMHWSSLTGLAPSDGQAKLTLFEVSSALSPLKPLGSYELTLQGGAAPKLQLHTLDAKLQLSGSGGWRDGRWQFSGEAQASEGYEQVLGNLLGVLGQRQGQRAMFQWG